MTGELLMLAVSFFSTEPYLLRHKETQRPFNSCIIRSSELCQCLISLLDQSKDLHLDRIGCLFHELTNSLVLLLPAAQWY